MNLVGNKESFNGKTQFSLNPSFPIPNSHKAMQLSQNPNVSNSINPNFIFCNSNYFSPLKFKDLGFSAAVFPSFKLRVPHSINFSGTRRRRFTPFVAAAAATNRASGSDYYSVLNVRRIATLQEIKAAYRSLARKVYVFSYSSFLSG